MGIAGELFGGISRLLWRNLERFQYLPPFSTTITFVDQEPSRKEEEQIPTIAGCVRFTLVKWVGCLGVGGGGVLVLKNCSVCEDGYITRSGIICQIWASKTSYCHSQSIRFAHGLTPGLLVWAHDRQISKLFQTCLSSRAEGQHVDYLANEKWTERTKRYKQPRSCAGEYRTEVLVGLQTLVGLCTY